MDPHPNVFPIEFSDAMMHAILAGRKSVTRRVVLPQPKWYPHKGVLAFDDAVNRGIRCPWGERGDVLWVRERMRVLDVHHGRDHTHEGVCRVRLQYETTGEDAGWHDYPDRLEASPVVGACLPEGGFMEAARLWLRVTNVRVVRLQDVTEEDALAEGLQRTRDDRYWLGHDIHDVKETLKIYGSATRAFKSLWNSFAPEHDYAWDQNPWVWRIAFERTEPPA